MRKIAKARHVIYEKLRGFTPPLDAAIEFRIRLYIEPSFQIGPAKLQPANPRVQQVVSLGECFNSLAAISLLQDGLSLNDFGIGLRFGFRLGAEAGGQFLRFGYFSSLRKDPPRQEPDLYGLAISQSLVGGGNCRSLLCAQELCVSEGSKLVRGAVRVLGGQIGGCALFEETHSICETAIIDIQIGQTCGGHGSALATNLLQLVIAFDSFRHLALPYLRLSQIEVAHHQGRVDL